MLKEKMPSSQLEKCFDRLYKTPTSSSSASVYSPLRSPSSSFTPTISEYARKMKRDNSEQLFQSLHDEGKKSCQKKKEQREKLLKEEMAECTFKPNLKHNIKSIPPPPPPPPSRLRVMSKKKEDEKSAQFSNVLEPKGGIKPQVQHTKANQKPPPLLRHYRNPRKHAEDEKSNPFGEVMESIRGQKLILKKAVTKKLPPRNPPQPPTAVKRKGERTKKMSIPRAGEFLTYMKHIETFDILLQQVRETGRNVTGDVDDVEDDNNCSEEGMNKPEDCKADPETSLTSFPNAFCSICRDDENTEECRMIKLSSCQHFAHAACLQQQLFARWSGKSISFTYLQCGECRTPLTHDTLRRDMLPHFHLKKQVEKICLQQAEADGLVDDFNKKMAENEEETTAYCMSTFSCFLCVQCSEPFCGGRVDCAADDQLDVSALRCPSCSFGETIEVDRPVTNSAWRGKCTTHGYKYAIYKCDSCCSVATWDCRSNHYCERCHNKASSHKDFKCPGVKKCPLGISHPPNSAGVHGQVENGFVIGCSKCFLGPQHCKDFELVTDSSARQYLENWKNRF